MVDLDRSAIMIPRRTRSIHEKFALTHYNCADGNCFIMHIWIAIAFDVGMHRTSAGGNHWLIDWLIKNGGMLSEFKTS